MGDLLDRETAREFLAGGYLAGRCGAFALALARRTGWPLVALRGPGGELRHVGCRSPGGYADARGILGAADFAVGFEGAVGPVPIDEATLRAEYPQCERAVRTADLHVEMLVGVPGTGPARAGMEAFAADLHALCVSHGIHLRGAGAGAGAALVAYRSDGAERGYSVAMAPLGDAVLTRAFS